MGKNKEWKVFDKNFNSFKEMCEFYKVKESTVRTRMERGYTLENALTQTKEQGRAKSIKNLSKNNVCLDEEEVRNRFLKHGYKILDYTYKVHDDKILCEDNEGYRVYVTLINVEKGVQGRRFMLSCNTIENLIFNLNLYIQKNDYKCKVLDVYRGEKEEIKIKCLCECGNEFNIGMASFKNYNFGRCPKCVKIESQYEHKMEMLLIDLNIKYETQKRFDECKNKRPLPFDFYLKDKNILIEVDGEQHYEDFYKRTNRFGDFDKRQKLDNIKNEFCIKNKIKLIRIPYYMFNDGTYKNYFITMLNN